MKRSTFPSVLEERPGDDAGVPFERMYDSFRLFGLQAQRWQRDFIPLSAGANWLKPNAAVLALLQHEMNHALTLRNYGGAGGLPPIVALLRFVERRLHGVRDLDVTITHGTSEAAYLAMQYIARQKLESSRALMIGHGFPLYGQLCSEFDLRFRQCLGSPSRLSQFMPMGNEIEEALSRHSPGVVFLILPNNPLGEMIDECSLRIIADYVARTGTFLLVDRVCLMPWDEVGPLFRLIGPLIADGRALIVDSLSKSESIAGLRVGYLVSAPAVATDIRHALRSRFLNPVVFPTATLALVRLAQTAGQTAHRVLDLYGRAEEQIFSEYPRDESFGELFEGAKRLIPQYIDESTRRHRSIVTNYDFLRNAMNNSLVRPLLFAGGFNIALCINNMSSRSEEKDQLILAESQGVGVLTSRCFCISTTDSMYFVRISLALSRPDFRRGIERLASYYSRIGDRFS